MHHSTRLVSAGGVVNRIAMNTAATRAKAPAPEVHSPAMRERTLGGLHDFLFAQVFSAHLAPGIHVADLGAGTGALAVRLRDAGCNVVPVDCDLSGYAADIPAMCLDLNEANFSQKVGEGKFRLVTSVEVIEHLEAPINFLRNVRKLLNREGAAIITTPNVQNTPARLKFLLRGTIRSMDARGDATHITPIFLDLLRRQYLPQANLQLAAYHAFPPTGFKLTRPGLALAMRLLSHLVGGEAKVGDINVLVLTSVNHEDPASSTLS